MTDQEHTNEIFKQFIDNNKIDPKSLISGWTESAIPQELPEVLPVCEHEWELIDDSFDHEYGTQTIIFERCKFCEKERDYEWPDFEYEGY